jgi:hypothetical protein
MRSVKSSLVLCCNIFAAGTQNPKLVKRTPKTIPKTCVVSVWCGTHGRTERSNLNFQFHGNYVHSWLNLRSLTSVDCFVSSRYCL